VADGANARGVLARVAKSGRFMGVSG